MVATACEKEDPEDTTALASNRNKKSMKALTAVSGFLLNAVCESLGSIPKSTIPVWIS